MSTPKKPADKPAADAQADAAEAQAEQMREAAEQREDPEQRLDETVDGGRYEVNGQMVDAEGKPLKDK